MRKNGEGTRNKKPRRTRTPRILTAIFFFFGGRCNTSDAILPSTTKTHFSAAHTASTPSTTPLPAGFSANVSRAAALLTLPDKHRPTVYVLAGVEAAADGGAGGATGAAGGAAAARTAPATVLRSSMAIVIGPTPPGTCRTTFGGAATNRSARWVVRVGGVVICTKKGTSPKGS